MLKNPLQTGKLPIFPLDRYAWHINQYASTLLSQIQRWHQNAKTRKQLAHLPPYLYRDIGLTNQQVSSEIKKYFWQ